ncbi:hypothetical protein ACFPYJ_32675 [Paenibacillus solisilvae]|uniref:Uncharacterized protein n=1 Tax=Paenibacillus solisilvae TaxID=2486751 RepID=A0ABW0WAN9_9BACL
MNLRSTLFKNRTRLFAIGVATFISLFCLNLDSKKAEAADGGLLPLGNSVGSVQVTDQDQRKQKPESQIQTNSSFLKNTSQEPIQALGVKQAVPQLKVDIPVVNLTTPETVGDTATKALTNVSDIASKTTAAVSDPAAKAVTNVSDIASKTTAAVSDPAAKAVTNVSDIASKTTAAVSDTAAKAVTNVSDIASKTTAAVSNTAAKAVTNLSDMTSKPPVVEPVSPIPKSSGSSPAIAYLQQTKMSEPLMGEGKNKKNSKADMHSVTIKSLNGSKRQQQPFPKSLPEKHSDVPVLPPAPILRGENHSSGSSSRDNGGSNSFGKQSMVESPLLDVSLPQYTGQLFNRRDIGINQWSQPPPVKPPQSTFFS